MANRILAFAVRNALKAPMGASQIHHLPKIGNRDVVGYGWNGQTCYADRVDYPMPAIRFKENTPDIMALREKEKGCWKKMSMQEKKALYRASFCQTFAEFKHPSGQWKEVIGFAFMTASAAIVVYLIMSAYVYPETPITFDEEHQKAQLKRMLDLNINPIHGLSSKWDYDNNKWK